MSFPLLFSLVVAQLLGAFLLAGGLISLSGAIFGKHVAHRILSALSAVVRIAVGITMFVCMTSSVLIITLMFAIYLFVEGVFLCIGAFQMRANPGWVWTLISGIASLVLGVLVYERWPTDAAWLLGLFFGINMIFNASAMLALAFAAPGKSPA